MIQNILNDVSTTMASPNVEIKDIIHNMFYKDIANIIVEFLFKECSICDKLYETTFLYPMVANKVICLYCIRSNVNFKRCCECSKYYYYPLNEFCSFCLSPCKVHCRNCVLNAYTIQ